MLYNNGDSSDKACRVLSFIYCETSLHIYIQSEAETAWQKWEGSALIKWEVIHIHSE